MNVIGLLFGGVVMLALIFFGIGASQTLISGTNITSSDEMYDQYQTSKEVATQTFTFMAYIPYLAFIACFFGILLVLTKTVR